MSRAGKPAWVTGTKDSAKEPDNQMGNWMYGSVWPYRPNKVAPIVFAILFLISGVFHAWQTKHYKSWRITLLMPWAAILFCIGFILREIAAYNEGSVNLLIASTVFLLSGPPVYAAALYFVLGRMLYYIPYLAPLHPGRVVTTFIGLDGFIETLVATGASYMTNPSLSETQRVVGVYLVKVSLVLQTVLFLCAIGIAALFHYRAARANVLPRNILMVCIMMYISSSLIAARCIYRIVEFFEGFEGTLYTNEPYFWVFEGALMFVNTCVINALHPGRYLPRNNHIFLCQDGITERTGPGWVDKRPFIVTLFDPFDLTGIITRRDRKERFWEMDQQEYEEWLEKHNIEKAEKKKKKQERKRGRWWYWVLDPFRLFGRYGALTGARRRFTSKTSAGSEGKEIPTRGHSASDDVPRSEHATHQKEVQHKVQEV